MANADTAQEGLAPGDAAVDRESDTSNYVIVLERLRDPIKQCVVYAEPDGTAHTVEEYNKNIEYVSPDDEGIVVAYVETVQARFDSPWTIDDVLKSYEQGTLTSDRGDGGYGVKTYTMPESRLRAVDHER